MRISLYIYMPNYNHMPNRFFTLLFAALLPCMSHARNLTSATQPRPLSFIENNGQIIDQYGKPRKDIDAKLETPGMVVFVGDAVIHYQWTKTVAAKARPVKLPGEKNFSSEANSIETYRMDVELVGANKKAVCIKEEKCEYYEYHYLPQCPEGARTASYDRLVYKDVYPGIDWVLYSSNNALKYDFIVHEGADPKNIRLEYKGASSLKNNKGAIVAATPFGSITEEAPYCYQLKSGLPVSSAYRLQGNVVSFDLAAFKGELVIDPSIHWATYFGGPNADASGEIAADPQGNCYMVGYTHSLSNIATTGAYQTTASTGTGQGVGGDEGFLVKFSAAGARLWATYYGGTGDDVLCSVAIDPSGNVYAAGGSNSAGLASSGAHQTSITNYGSLLIKFTSAGARLWATYYGYTGYSNGPPSSVACDLSGNVYLGGQTTSTTGIATSGAHQQTKNAGFDAFIAKFSASGTRIWGTYYGGTGNEVGSAVACDNSGSVYLAGTTQSSTGIATSGAHQATYGGGTDGYLAKFNASNGSLSWATYYGVSGYDEINDVGCDGIDDVYIVGATGSTSGLATTGAHQVTNGGGTGGVMDGLLAKFNSGGTRQWASYYGGSGNDYMHSLAMTTGNTWYFAGTSGSDTGIATPNGYQTSRFPGHCCLVEMNAAGNRSWGSYYPVTGGNSLMSANGWAGASTAWSSSGYLFADGHTVDSGLATPNAYQTYVFPTGGGWGECMLFAFHLDSILAITLPFNDTVFCPGDSFKVAFNLTSNFKSGNVFTVQLSNDTGTFSTFSNIGSKTISVSDTIKCIIPAQAKPGNKYRIRIVSTNPVRTSNNNGVNIRVKEPPQTLTASANTPVCLGDTLSLAATTTTAGTVSYSWSGPGSFTSALQNPSIYNVQLSHAGNYYLSAVHEGCISKDTVTVSVITIPATPVAGNDGPLCTGDTLHLTAASTTPGVSYSWTGPGSFTSGSPNAQISGVTTLNNGSYSVTASLNGCVSPAAATNVVVHPATPKPSAGADMVACAGVALNLSATNVPGAGYSWAGPGAFNSTSQNPVINPVLPKHAGDYTVMAILNNCPSEADTVNIFVNSVSSIGAYVSPNDTVCAGTQLSFVAVPSNGGPAPQYQWFKNSVIIPGATSLTYSTTNYVSGDSFYCRMIAPGICSSPLTLYTPGIEITVLPITTTPTITITSNPNPAKPGVLNNFAATVTNGGGAPTYQWRRNGTDQGGATNANWSASGLHPYDKISCIVTSSDPCASPKNATSNEIVVNFTTGIDDVGNDEGLSLYPNPNDGRFSLLLTPPAVGGTGSQGGGTYSVEVVNVMGQVVYSLDIPLNPFKGGIKVLLPAIVVSGVYLLRVKSGDEVKTLRFTVSR
jgi:hypothetical protein